MNNNIIIKDKSIESTLAKDGFIKVQMIEQNEIRQLLSLYDACFLETQKINKSNLNSIADCTSEQKNKISEGIQKILKPRIDMIFENYDFLPGIFFIKKSSSDSNSRVNMHQDPTLLIDESENCHIKIWIPLMDVDESNGALQLIRGSHRFVPPVSAVTIPSHFSKVEDWLYEVKECVCMKAGEALMFDNRTIHCSMPNLSDKTRITAIQSIVASNRQFINLYQDPNIKNAPIEVYFQKHDWYMHPLWSNSFERPKIGKKAGVLDYKPFFLKKEEFLDLANNPRPYKTYKYKIVPDKKENSLLKFIRSLVNKSK